LSSAECQRRSHKIELWLWQACRGWFHCCRWHRLQKDLTIRWSCSRAAAELCWRLRFVHFLVVALEFVVEQEFGLVDDPEGRVQREMDTILIEDGVVAEIYDFPI